MPTEQNHCCTGCYACYCACPVKCIAMVEDNEGFAYPVVDHERCIKCGICRKACPVKNGARPKNKTGLAFACYAQADEVRLNSSSGGVFSLLAQSIVSQGGVVFGAGYDENFEVVHKCVSAAREIGSVRGSKYVQSKPGEAYIAARQYLTQKRPVLFVGTPCQIAGLKNYLEKDYENLTCVDFICHGVPSPKVWRNYIRSIQTRHNSTIREVFFRCKESGWGNYSLKIDLNNGQTYRRPCSEDPLLRGFAQNLFLRPSCHNCRFKSLARHSDITLADFWGIENILPEEYSEKGVSLVLINSEKGKRLFSALHEAIFFRQTDTLAAIKNNPSMTASSLKSINRGKFFGRLDEQDDISQWIDKNLINLQLLRVLNMIGKINAKFAEKLTAGLNP